MQAWQHPWDVLVHQFFRNNLPLQLYSVSTSERLSISHLFSITKYIMYSTHFFLFNRFFDSAEVNAWSRDSAIKKTVQRSVWRSCDRQSDGHNRQVGHTHVRFFGTLTQGFFECNSTEYNADKLDAHVTIFSELWLKVSLNAIVLNVTLDWFNQPPTRIILRKWHVNARGWICDKRVPWMASVMNYEWVFQWWRHVIASHHWIAMSHLIRQPPVTTAEWTLE